MKKFIFTFCAVALAIALTMPALAQTPEFKGRAWYMIQGISAKNISDFNDDSSSDCYGFAYSRFRWWLDMNFGKEYGGTVGFEGDWWWGSDVNRTTSWGGQSQDQFDVEWKHAYVWFLIPGTKMKMTGGLQMFVIDPDLIMFGANSDWWSWRLDVPLGKAANLTLAWLKQAEGQGAVPTYPATYSSTTTDNSDDAEYYLLNLTGALGKTLSGGFYSLYLYTRDDNAGVNLGYAESRGLLSAKRGYMWWNGLHLSFTPGPIYFKFHGNYLMGSLGKEAYGYADDIEVRAYALLGELGFKAKSGFRVGLRGWYFTGNDDNFEWSASSSKKDWKRWVTPDAFFCPTEIFYLGARFWSPYAYLGHVGNPGGTWAWGLDGFVPFSKTLNLMWTIMNIGWTNGEYDKPTAFLGSAPYKNEGECAGYELNLLLTYRPYANLEMNFLFAYFFAQSGLDRNPGSPTNEMTADNAIEVGYRVLFTF